MAPQRTLILIGGALFGWACGNSNEGGNTVNSSGVGGSTASTTTGASAETGSTATSEGAGGNATSVTSTGTGGAPGQSAANSSSDGSVGSGGMIGTGGAGGMGTVGTTGTVDGSTVLDPDQILSDQGLDQPGWYRDNIPFLDTPDATINEIYYYRWSTYKRDLRYTTSDVGYVSTEYTNQIWYSGNEFSYGALSDAAGYHILDGRWARNRNYVDDYLNFWLTGPGTVHVRNFSEWIISAAYRRSLVTGDTTLLESNLDALISLYDAWRSKYTQNITVNGTPTSHGLYFQSPLADATEYTETSMHSTDWFGGGVGFRPTLNSYLYGAALAISEIANGVGDSATANDFAARAADLKASVQETLWDPERQFFMQVYNDDATNSGLAWSRTTWREAMGFAPWAFELPDASFSAAWQSIDDPQRFAGPFGLTTLERFHEFEAEQGDVANANVVASSTASGGSYVGQIDAGNSSVAFTVYAPRSGTFPVEVFYANGSGATSTHNLVVNGGGSPITVTYPPTEAWGTFSDSQKVALQVPLKEGANTLKFSPGTGGGSELDRIDANPYFVYQAFPAVQNHDDSNCCHWNGPSWPYATSQMLTGLANLLQDYRAQSYVTKQTYFALLSQFAEQQHRDGVPHVAEAANADTGEWVYDAVDFSEHYNHSSFIDLVLTGLLGIKPQADDTLVLHPLVPDDWSYFAVQNLPYHGHLLSIVWDADGTHYNAGSGLRVYQDGTPIFEAADLAEAMLDVAAPVQPPEQTRLQNVAANAWLFDQEWLKAWDNRSYTPNFPSAFASYTKTEPNGLRCRSSDNPRCTDAYDSPNKVINGYIRYDVVPDDRWTNVGSPNATDFVGVDFGSQREVDQLTIYTYDNGGDVLAPQAFDVEYLSGDTWTSVPGQAKNPPTPAANDANEVTFPPVTTSQIRVVFTPQPGAYVGVTELESWYPAP